MNRGIIGIAENVKPKGSLSLMIYKKGRLYEEFIEDNLIVNSGKAWLANLLKGSSEEAVSHVGVGTNGATPEPLDVDLTNKVLIPIDSSEVVGQNLTIHFSIDVNTGNGTDILEFGLFGSNGTLFARRIRTTAIPKDQEINILGTWTIRF